MTVGRLMAASSEASATTSMSSSPQGAAGAVAGQWLIVGEQDPVSGPVHIGRERPLGVGDVTITGSPAARACHQALCWHRPRPSPSSVLCSTVWTWITEMQCVSESCRPCGRFAADPPSPCPGPLRPCPVASSVRCSTSRMCSCHMRNVATMTPAEISHPAGWNFAGPPCAFSERTRPDRESVRHR